MNDKKSLRKIIKSAVSQLSDAEKCVKSDAIFAQIEQLEKFKKSSTILIYWSLPDEVETIRFIDKWHHQKTFLLPSVQGERMVFKKFISADKNIKGELDIFEPQGEVVDINQFRDLICIVPGIAFTPQGQRMGRGKGFYDGFLSEHPELYKIGVCFEEQILNEIPTEPHDIEMNTVVFK